MKKNEDLGAYFKRVILYPFDGCVDPDVNDRFCVGTDGDSLGEKIVSHSMIMSTFLEDKMSDKKPTVTREWIKDLGDLLWDLEHSHEEPVDRAEGQRSADEVWTEIEEMFDGIDVKIKI